MSSIPLFDSLTHPTPDGTWLDPRYNGRVDADSLRQQMEATEVSKVMAVGMGDNVGGYQELKYAEWVRSRIPGGYPVAYCSPLDCETSDQALSDQFRSLHAAGYVGIKLHPRMGGFTFQDPQVASVIQAAHESGLFAMLCTYPYGSEIDCGGVSLSTLTTLLNTLSNDTRLILLHGGLTNLLEWSEALRHRPGVLLDLSFTLQRFEGSSVDLDIQFLFRTFDQRICVGSDHPQYSLQDLRRRFDHFASEIPVQKAQNIGYANLSKLLDGKRT